MGDVDARENCANLVIPLDSGNSSNQEFVLRTFGTANWTQFCPGLSRRSFSEGGLESGHEVEFFLWSEMYVNAGSLTSTYRVVRKYNFKS